MPISPLQLQAALEPTEKGPPRPPRKSSCAQRMSWGDYAALACAQLGGQVNEASRYTGSWRPRRIF